MQTRKLPYMHRIAVAAMLALIGFLALNLLAYNHARAMTHFVAEGQRTGKPEELTLWQKADVLLSGLRLPRPTTQHAPTELAADCKRMRINESDGVSLGTWYCDRGPASPVVLLFHGYGAEKTAQLPQASAFLDLDCSVLLVDFRGSGESSESYTTIGIREADDVAAVFNFARQRLPHARVLLYGQSMGGVAILKAIHDQGLRPDAVIIEGVFDTMLSTVRNRFEAMHVPAFPSAELLVFWGGLQWGFDGFAHNPVEYAAALRSPVLFMHGENDPRAKLAEGRRVFDAAPGVKEFVVFDKAGHESYLTSHPAHWRSAVKKLLDANRA